jgi:hypothetical protein
MAHRAPGGARILVLHPDRKSQRIIHRILGGTFSTIDVAETVEQARLLLRNEPRLAVVDYEVTRNEAFGHFASAAARLNGCSVLVLVGDLAEHDVPGALESAAFSNLLAHPMPLLAEELASTALKLLHQDIFGLEKYLAWGVVPRSCELRRASDRRTAVAQVDRDVRTFGLGPRITSLAVLIADELMSNAIYNAPVDELGVHYRKDLSRCAEQEFSERERIRLRYACDARYLAIEVTDRFGSVDTRTILKHLRKAGDRNLRDKVNLNGPGAGMGIALAYSCANHLVFNIAPGSCTEVLALVDVRFRPNELRSTMSSFNVFVQGGGDGHA